MIGGPKPRSTLPPTAWKCLYLYAEENQKSDFRQNADHFPDGAKLLY